MGNICANYFEFGPEGEHENYCFYLLLALVTILFSGAEPKQFGRAAQKVKILI